MRGVQCARSPVRLLVAGIRPFSEQAVKLKKSRHPFLWSVAIGGTGWFIFLPFDREQYLSSIQQRTPEEEKTFTTSQMKYMKMLPLILYSHTCGFLSNLTVPGPLRHPLYSFFLKRVHGSAEEIEKPLSEYPTFNSFFARHLVPSTRPFNTTPGSVDSPVDARVLYLGKIEPGDPNPQLQQVKGVRFSLKDFLGNVPITENPLYYCILYLSPADYHRVHSPIDWSLSHMEHHPGYVFSVSPKWAGRIRGLFNVNERMVMKGHSSAGFFSMSLVAATGVGSIVLKDLPSLHTNRDWARSGVIRTYATNSRHTLGSEIGNFELGSTVVLVFESPKFHFTVKEGQKVKCGERIGDMQ